MRGRCIKIQNLDRKQKKKGKKTENNGKKTEICEAGGSIPEKNGKKRKFAKPVGPFRGKKGNKNGKKRKSAKPVGPFREKKRKKTGSVSPFRTPEKGAPVYDTLHGTPALPRALSDIAAMLPPATGLNTHEPYWHEARAWASTPPWGFTPKLVQAQGGGGLLGAHRSESPSDKRRLYRLHARGRWHLGRRVNAARSAHTHTRARLLTPHRSARSRARCAPGDCPQQLPNPSMRPTTRKAA